MEEKQFCAVLISGLLSAFLIFSETDSWKLAVVACILLLSLGILVILVFSIAVKLKAINPDE